MIRLPDEVKAAINNALADNYPVVWTSVGADGQPSSNFFGSTLTLSDHELAIWLRTPSRGFLARIAANPQVCMLYRNHSTRMGFQIHGEARQVEDEETERRVYDASPEAERNADPNRAGAAVVIDVVRLIQGGQVTQSRDGDAGARVD